MHTEGKTGKINAEGGCLVESFLRNRGKILNAGITDRRINVVFAKRGNGYLLRKGDGENISARACFPYSLMNEGQKRRIEIQRSLNRYAVKKQILFTGSSLMEQFPIEELRLSEGIEPYIYNRGVGGFRTEDMLECMEEMVFGVDPEKIFINIGTNDISAAPVKEESWLAHLTGNYSKILGQIKDRLPNCEVYVMAYYPSNMEVIQERGSVFAALRTLENIALADQENEKLARHYGYHFIRVNEGITDSEGNLKREFTTDGIHMVPDAYVRILKNLKPYLVRE